jgi:hypothetical protein
MIAASVARPPKEPEHRAKMALERGETTTVRLSIDLASSANLRGPQTDGLRRGAAAASLERKVIINGL